MIENEKMDRNINKSHNRSNIDKSNKYIINTILTNYHRTNTIFST